VAYSHRPNTAPVYEAVRRWKEAALATDDSLFTPGAPVWSAATADDLHRRFNLQPDESSSSFMEKFERQLAGASRLTVQLAAELFYVHLVVANDLLGSTKRALVTKVLGFTPDAVALPADLATTLDTGLGATGQAFKMYRPNQLWLLVDFTCGWKALTGERRHRLLSDPWAFKDWLMGIPMTAAFAQRNALLHLVHPETFEPIVSREHKAKIVAAFKDRASAPDGDVDRALLDIHTSLAAEYGKDFDFYRDDEVVTQWLKAPEPKKQTADSPAARHAWLVRGANVNGHNLIATWLDEGYCSIGWYDLGELPPNPDRADLRSRVDETYPDEPSQAQANYVGVLHRFLTQMS
jgi:5-methylcytosine-specific restriction protein B